MAGVKGCRSKGRTVEERFWDKVDRNGPVHPVLGTQCWLWTGRLNPEGYGRLRVYGVGVVRAHRYAYELLVGSIPEGHQLDHVCRNRRCVNPDHLRPVTNKQNHENHAGRGNSNNTSGVRGVYWHKQRNKWTTQTQNYGQRYTAGCYDAIEDAEAAIIELRKLLHTHNDADRI